MQQWLGAAAGPTRDYSGAWFVPAESGWGLTVFNFPGQMFALFFVYESLQEFLRPQTGVLAFLRGAL